LRCTLPRRQGDTPGSRCGKLAPVLLMELESNRHTGEM
jgi:hypothetical protein